MGLELYADKLPPELQEAYKQEVSRAVIIASKEDAKKFLMENQYVNAEFQSQLSLKHEESMKKFNNEKLPVLIEEEIKKKTSKQPWEIEIEKMRAENEALKRESVLKERRVAAISELSKIGLDPSLADFVVSDDEEKFKSNIDILIGKATSWRDAEIQKVKESTFSQRSPQGGNTNPQDLKAQYKAALDSGNIALSIQIQDQMAKALQN